MKTQMHKYLEMVELKSYLKGAAAWNQLEGAEELTEEQWEEMYEYAVQLGDNLKNMENDEERIKYLIEGVLLHILIDIIEGNYS